MTIALRKEKKNTTVYIIHTYMHKGAGAVMR
jgi:hypothetical protein